MLYQFYVSGDSLFSEKSEIDYYGRLPTRNSILSDNNAEKNYKFIHPKETIF